MKIPRIRLNIEPSRIMRPSQSSTSTKWDKQATGENKQPLPAANTTCRQRERDGGRAEMLPEAWGGDHRRHLPRVRPCSFRFLSMQCEFVKDLLFMIQLHRNGKRSFSLLLLHFCNCITHIQFLNEIEKLGFLSTNRFWEGGC